MTRKLTLLLVALALESVALVPAYSTAIYQQRLSFVGKPNQPNSRVAHSAPPQGVAAVPQKPWVSTGASATTFSITSYIHGKRDDIFKPAWDELQCYKVRYSEDEGLLSALQMATGDTSACKN